MITKITSENYGSYKPLFDEATEALGFDIQNLDAYMANLPSLREIEMSPETPYDHHFTTLPLDEPPFAVNADSRQIEIPNEFKKNGLAVIGDHLAEMVYFSIDRYYDTWDLLSEGMRAIVQWAFIKGGKEGAKGISPITTIDATILAKDRKLLFGWPIDNSITGEAGTIRFSVRFYKMAEIQGENHLVFNMNTIPTNLEVKAGLNFMEGNNFTQEFTDISNVFEQRFSAGFGYVNGDGAETPWFIIPLSFYDETEKEITEIEFEDGKDVKIVDLLPQDNEETPLKLIIGLTSGGNGKVTYSVSSTEFSGTEPTYPVYIQTKDTIAQEGKVYYKYDTEREDYISVSVLTGDSVVPTEEELDEATTVINPGTEEEETIIDEHVYYYECLNCYDITGVGTYWIKSSNFVEPASTKHKDSKKILVPRPVKPTVEVEEHGFLTEIPGEEEGEVTYKLLIPVTGHTNQEGDVLNYTINGFTWGENTESFYRESEPDEPLENNEEFVFDLGEIIGEETGSYTTSLYDVTFYVSAKASRNGANITSDQSTIRITHAPEHFTFEEGDENQILLISPGTTIDFVISNKDTIKHDNITYKWCKATSIVGDDESIKNPETGELYGTEPTFTPPGEGRYYCIVTNYLNGAEIETRTPSWMVS